MSATERAKQQEVRAARQKVDEFFTALEAVCKEGFVIRLDTTAGAVQVGNITFADKHSDYTQTYEMGG